MKKKKLSEAKKAAKAPAKKLEFRVSKHRKYGHVYGEDVPIPAGRAAFVYLVEPKDPPPSDDPDKEPGAPRYEYVHLLDKDDPTVEKFKDYIEKMAEQMEELFNKGKGTKLSVEDVFLDGDDSDRFDPEKYPFYENKWLLNVRSYKPIRCVSPEDPTEQIDPSVIVGGVEVAAVVTPMLTSHGVSYKARIIQFIEDDGTRFAGGASPESYASMLTPVTSKKKKAVQEVDEDEVEDDEDEDDEEEEAPKEVVKKKTTSKKAKAKQKVEVVEAEDEDEDEDDDDDIQDLNSVAIDDL